MRPLFVSVLSIALLIAPSRLLRTEDAHPCSRAVISEAAAPLRAERYGEALKKIEAGLKTCPDNCTLQGFKVKALMGLGRYEDAMSLASVQARLHPEWPVLRLLAGDCAFQLGRPIAAIGQWSVLYGRRDLAWAVDAYQRSATALIAMGKPNEAMDLLKEAMGTLSDDIPSLLAIQCKLTRSAPEGERLLGRLIKLDKWNAEQYRRRKRLYEAAGRASLLEEDDAGRGAVTVNLRSQRLRLGGAKWEAAEPTQLGSGYNPVTLVSSKTCDTYSAMSVPVKIDGAGRRRLFLDSGTSSVFITKKVADILGLEPVAPATFRNPAFGAEQNSWWVMIKKMTVAGIQFRNIPAVVVDSQSGIWKKSDGILPLSLFRRHGVVLDGAHRKLTILPAGAAYAEVLGAGSFRLTALWLDGMPFVLMGVQHGPDRFFLLDTGANGSYMGREALGWLGLSVEPECADHPVKGMVGMSYPDRVGEFDLVIGGRRYRVPDCYVVDLFQDGPLKYCGIIGRNVLQTFRIYFDYSTGTVAFRPYRKSKVG